MREGCVRRVLSPAGPPVVQHQVVNLGELAFQPAEEGPRLHVLPLLDGLLQILHEFLLLLNQLGRNSQNAGAHAPIGARAMQTVELLGRLFQALGQRGDKLIPVGQLGLEGFHSFRRKFCFDHPAATVARVVPVRAGSVPSMVRAFRHLNSSTTNAAAGRWPNVNCGKKATP